MRDSEDEVFTGAIVSTVAVGNLKSISFDSLDRSIQCVFATSVCFFTFVQIRKSSMFDLSEIGHAESRIQWTLSARHAVV